MVAKKLLILGNGFVGREFQRRGHVTTTREQFDFSNPAQAELQFKTLIRKHKPTAVVNCIGFANTRDCEKPELWRQTFNLNTLLPKHLSDWSRVYGVRFVHISTGCVYDGFDEEHPATEKSNTTAYSNYVVSKIAGENCCDRGRDVILRPRLLFSNTSEPQNLLLKMDNMRKLLTAQNSYTSLKTIVESTEALVRGELCGVFNVAEDGHASMFDLSKLCGMTDKEKMDLSLLRKLESYKSPVNVMSIKKLKRYYQPNKLENSICESWFDLMSSK